MIKIIKFLMRFDKFRAGILRAAFELQFEPVKEIDRLKYVLTDSNGLKYYEYIKDDWIPIQRYEQMYIRLMEIDARIGRESLQSYADVTRKLAQKNDLIGVAKMCGELETRLGLLYDPDIMFRFICGLLIREDQLETAHTWNQLTENEKYNQLMKDNENGNLSFFFQLTNLERHLKFSSSSGLGYKNLMTEEMIQANLKGVRLFDQMIQKVSLSLSPKS